MISVCAVTIDKGRDLNRISFIKIRLFQGILENTMGRVIFHPYQSIPVFGFKEASFWMGHICSLRQFGVHKLWTIWMKWIGVSPLLTYLIARPLLQTFVWLMSKYQFKNVILLRTLCKSDTKSKIFLLCLLLQVVSGGVASNQVVRSRLTSVTLEVGLRLVCPPPRLCTDNGIRHILL